MSKIFSYLWTSAGPEYKLVTQDELENDKDVVKSYINSDYPKVLLLYYKSGAGGLFLTNCLALSENVYTLYDKIDDKLQFLLDSLEKQTLFWNDISLIPPVIEYDIPEVSHKNRYTVIYDHNPKNIKKHLKCWNNLDVIYFNNSDLFCRIRRLLKNYYSRLIDNSCEYVKLYRRYKIPNTIKEYRKLPLKNKKKLLQLYNDDQKIYSFSFLKNRKLFYVWDTNWYFSEEDTVTHIKELYDLFGFKDFDKKSIILYYRKWISTLDFLKTTKIPENLNVILKDKNNLDKSIVLHDEKEPI